MDVTNSERTKDELQREIGKELRSGWPYGVNIELWLHERLIAFCNTSDKVAQFIFHSSTSAVYSRKELTNQSCCSIDFYLPVSRSNGAHLTSVEVARQWHSDRDCAMLLAFLEWTKNPNWSWRDGNG